MKTLARWLGANDDIIKEMVFEALKTESEEYQTKPQEVQIQFTDKDLPEGSMPLLDWANSEYWKDIALEVEPIIAYVVSRGYDPFDGNFYWSPASGYTSRVIIPFRWEGRIVGNTARKVTDGKPKYLSDQHPFFVFNVDAQHEEKKYVFVCEGPFDALSLGGVALLTNEISAQQSRIINNIGAEVIVIPDQDIAGLILIDQAKDLGWKVAFPNWDSDVKDCADAVQRYGKLFVIIDAIKTATDNPVKIEIEKRKRRDKFEFMEKQHD
jgi:hypothetical protein